MAKARDGEWDMGEGGRNGEWMANDLEQDWIQEANCQPPLGQEVREGDSRTCGSRWSSASPQRVLTARAPRKPSRGCNR